MNHPNTDSEDGPGLVESLVCWLGGALLSLACWTLIWVGVAGFFDRIN